MERECPVINPPVNTSGSQTVEIDRRKGIVTFGKGAAPGIEKDPQAPCILATWSNSENGSAITPNIRDCGRCTRRVSFKPTNG